MWLFDRDAKLELKRYPEDEENLLWGDEEAEDEDDFEEDDDGFDEEWSDEDELAEEEEPWAGARRDHEDW